MCFSGLFLNIFSVEITREVIVFKYTLKPINSIHFTKRKIMMRNCFQRNKRAHKLLNVLGMPGSCKQI